MNRSVLHKALACAFVSILFTAACVLPSGAEPTIPTVTGRYHSSGEAITVDYLLEVPQDK